MVLNNTRRTQTVPSARPISSAAAGPTCALNCLEDGQSFSDVEDGSVPSSKISLLASGGQPQLERESHSLKFIRVISLLH